MEQNPLNLTGVKLEKYGIFYPYYGEITDKFVMLCSGRGENSWTKVLEKIHYLDILPLGNIKSMVDDLYNRFQLEVEYSSVEIVKTIGIVAREHQVKPEQSTKWFFDWFAKLFLVEKVKNEDLKTIRYKPIFKLMPEQD